MLKAKIHRATLTGTALNYEGSITVDTALLDRAGILPGEQVHVLNVNTGDRFVTYTIPAPRRSGKVILNGPAARLGQPGDEVIILTYAQVGEEELRVIKPVVVLVDQRNRPVARRG
jgi:aspartate 1-decarboxylase